MSVESQKIGPPQSDEILATISRNGHWCMAKASAEEKRQILRGLGTTIYVTDVTVKPGSKALVTSDRALDYHTDHHRADLIAWYCLEQTDDGGETILIDAYALLRKLSAEQLHLLRSVKLFEHKVFDGDSELFPLLSEKFGREKVYYSFWVNRGDLTREQMEALLAFKSITETERPIRYRLEPSDLLVIDNGRMLHGRTAIGGNRRRFLKRYWIESLNNQTNYANTTST